MLFACAGGSLHGGPIVASDAAAWRATVDLNLVGTFLCIKHAAPLMMRERRRLDRRHVVDRGPHDPPVHERVLREQGRRSRCS